MNYLYRLFPTASYTAAALRRLQAWLYRLLNFLSFGVIRLPATSYLSDYYIATGSGSSSSSLAAITASGFNSSTGCLSSNSGESDTELSNGTTAPSTASAAFRRRRSPRTSVTEPSQVVAVDAVAHSYEDITRPDYHNYLWLSSAWDRTDLGGAGYFVANWVDQMRGVGGSGSVSGRVDGKRDGRLDGSRVDEKGDDSRVDGSRVDGRVDESGRIDDGRLDESTSKRDDVVQDVNSNSNTLLHNTLSTLTTLTNPTKHCKSFLNFHHHFSTLPDSFFPRRRITLPKRQKTLVLDLDETLIHSTAGSGVGFDFMIEVLIGRTSCLYYVYKRPHLDYFLEVVGNWFNLVIYTASLKEYADPVIDLLEGGRKLFKKRLFRSSCLSTNTPPFAYLKDLSLVDGGDLSKVALIDNSAASFALYPDNAIPIESWREGSKDQGLLDLLPFLDALRFVEDVRSVLSLRRLSLYMNK